MLETRRAVCFESSSCEVSKYRDLDLDLMNPSSRTLRL